MPKVTDVFEPGYPSPRCTARQWVGMAICTLPACGAIAMECYERGWRHALIMVCIAAAVISCAGIGLWLVLVAAKVPK